MIASSPYKNKNVFNFASQARFPITIDQKLIIVTLQISEHGKSGGVIFIQTDTGSIILKANNETPQDYFYNLLAQRLDVEVPLMETIGCYEQQFQRLIYLIQKYCHTDEVLYARLKSKLDFPFYQLIEYIPSISLAHTGIKKYKKNMCSLYKMYSIGICLAFDMIINNADRFKFVWRGDGNINNILIQLKKCDKWNLQKSKDREDETVQLGSFIFIDHSGHMINLQNYQAKQNAQKYITVVSEFHLNMIQYLRKQNSSLPSQFDRFRDQIKFYTQYKYDDEEIVKICEGIIYATKLFIDLYESGEVSQLHTSIIKPIDTKNKQVNYWNQYWNNQFKKVNLNFCQFFYIKISAIYTTYPQLINQIFSRVKAHVEANRRRRDRQNSKGSRKSSEIISKKSQQNMPEQDQSQQHDRPVQNQDQHEQNQRKRRWRQKLVQFKNQNYK